jgi:dihydroceramidase
MLALMVRDVDWVLTEDDYRIGPSSGGARAKVMLAPMIRALKLKTSRAVLFEMKEDVDAERGKHLVDLGNSIHKTWMGMKSGNIRQILGFKENNLLQDRLLAVFNAKHNKAKNQSKGKIDISDPRSNPLSLILPSFETLWRIVLRLFLVLHGHDDRKEEYKQTLLAFVQNPTPT